MLLGTMGASLLGNTLAGKRINRAGEGIVRAGYRNKKSSKSNNKNTRTELIFNAVSSFN